MNNKVKKGFTLIEMLIVALIFSILMGAIIGVFVSVIRVQRYTLSAQLLLDQTSYSMEYMSRSLRMAKKKGDFSCEHGCDHLNSEDSYSFSSDELCFINSDEECYAFFLYDNKFYGYNMKDYDVSLPIFSEDFTINAFNVNLIGESDGDSIQPRATLFLDMEAEAGKSDPKIKLQTTVSQRNLDL